MYNSASEARKAFSRESMLQREQAKTGTKDSPRDQGAASAQDEGGEENEEENMPPKQPGCCKLAINFVEHLTGFDVDGDGKGAEV